MPPPESVQERRKLFSVEDANKALPLVRQIVTDIVRQWKALSERKERLSVVSRRPSRPKPGDPYIEEVAQSQAEMEAEETKLREYMEELEKLGVELKGFDGLCDFPSLRDGREVYLCWRLGEPDVAHWHELNAGFAGRQPLAAPAGKRAR